MLSGFFVTKKGKNLLAKTHDGANIELTRAEIGSGDIPEGQLVTEVTSLYGKVKELPLGEVMVLPKIADPFIVSHNSSIDIHLDILTLIRPDDIMPM